MMLIRMTRDYDRFKSGDVIDHHDVMAERWIRRGLAEKCEGEAPRPAAPAEPEAGQLSDEPLAPRLEDAEQINPEGSINETLTAEGDEGDQQPDSDAEGDEAPDDGQAESTEAEAPRPKKPRKRK